MQRMSAPQETVRGQRNRLPGRMTSERVETLKDASALVPAVAFEWEEPTQSVTYKDAWRNAILDGGFQPPTLANVRSLSKFSV